MPWFIPLIAAGISAAGAIGGAAIKSRQARRQNALASEMADDANQVMNDQWQKEQDQRRKEAKDREMEGRRRDYQAAIAQMRSILGGAPNTSKKIIEIMGRGGR
jgi:Flp pilus assembly protein TadB